MGQSETGDVLIAWPQAAYGKNHTWFNLYAVDGGVFAPNTPPAAEAGPDQSVLQQSLVTLDATASSDPDGTVVGYRWQQLSGTSVALSGVYAATPTFTSPTLKNRPEDLLFQLTVMDDVGELSSDQVTITGQSVGEPGIARRRYKNHENEWDIHQGDCMGSPRILRGTCGERLRRGDGGLLPQRRAGLAGGGDWRAEEVLWREAYSPYGDRLRKEDGGSNSLWYTAKPHEADFDLSYSGARWYIPSAGRFTGIDPVGFQEEHLHSFNRYIYANNNPYKYVDPDGRFGLLLHSLQQGVSLEQAQTISGFGNGALAASASAAAAGVLVVTPGPDELLIGAGLGTTRLLGVTKGKGLGNPFKDKSAKQIDQMFKDKGFRESGPDLEWERWLCKPQYRSFLSHRPERVREIQRAQPCRCK